MTAAEYHQQQLEQQEQEELCRMYKHKGEFHHDFETCVSPGNDFAFLHLSSNNVNFSLCLEKHHMEVLINQLELALRRMK